MDTIIDDYEEIATNLQTWGVNLESKYKVINWKDFQAYLGVFVGVIGLYLY